MNCTQNSKLMQITPETMVVGVDIGSEVHFARAFDFRGFEFSRKAFRFENTRDGFHAFDTWVTELMKKNKKTKAFVGMEPTGHYWYGFGSHLQNMGVEFGMVNPYHVKRSKELDDNNPSKHDRKDPKTIAMLVKDGRFLIPYMPEGVYREIRNLMELRRQNVVQLISIQNRVKRWLAIYFPEFSTVFKKWTGKPDINDLASSKEEIKREKIEDDLLVQVSSGNSVYEKKIAVRGGKNHLTIQVEDPKLWWPNGYGQPDLYNYSVRLLRRGVEIDKKEGKFGIREIELKQEPLKEGGFGFQFNINGIPVYCKGANWVPVDCFTGTARGGKYENLINLAREANFNMLRVWGGGIYEKDIFYDLCDQNGIMVWQDFMFACSDVPDDHPWFVDMVIPEIEYQVKRLRNHPSVVYWCGGNEKTGSAGLKVSYGERMFRYIIRGICNDLDATRPYGAASPSSFSDLGNDMDSGDTHCNCLESSFKKGMTVFREEIEKIRTAFNSECAIQGPARYQSMSRFIPAEKLWPLNDLWEFRYKDNPYNTLTATYLDIQKNAAEKLFGRFDNVREFLKKAMTAHAEILRAEIEHQRCRKWANGGIMFWMYSDIWPTGTWSVVDYYELPKPAYYAVKRAYQPVLVSIQQIGGDTKVLISNDSLQELTGIAEFGQATIYGRTLWIKELNNITVMQNESVEVASAGGLILEIPDSYLFARFRGNGQTAGTTFFTKLWKDIDWREPGLSYEVISETSVDGRFEKTIKISAKLYARMVNINLPGNVNAHFSDNFFDLEAGGTKVITIVSGDNYGYNELRLGHWLTE